MRAVSQALERVRTVLWAAALVWLAAAGCGAPEFPKTYPVSGTVLLPDGTPLQGAKIEFESVADPNMRAFGEIEQDGTFATVYTYKSTGREVEGLIAGEHRVRFELASRDEDEGRARDPGEAGGRKPSRKRPGVIDPRYRDFDTSDLKVTIPAPDNRVTIRLEKSGR